MSKVSVCSTTRSDFHSTMEKVAKEVDGWGPKRQVSYTQVSTSYKKTGMVGNVSSKVQDSHTSSKGHR